MTKRSECKVQWSATIVFGVKGLSMLGVVLQELYSVKTRGGGEEKKEKKEEGDRGVGWFRFAGYASSVSPLKDQVEGGSLHLCGFLLFRLDQSYGDEIEGWFAMEVLPSLFINILGTLEGICIMSVLRPSVVEDACHGPKSGALLDSLS